MHIQFHTNKMYEQIQIPLILCDYFLHFISGGVKAQALR